MVNNKTQAGRRVATLVRELADVYARESGERGVGARIAKELGMDPGIVSKIRSGSYEPGDVDAGTIEEICKNLHIRASYFFDRWTDARSFREYLDSAPAPQAAHDPSSADAVANAALLDLIDAGERVTPEELRELRSVAGLASGAASVQEAKHRFTRYLAGMRATTQRERQAPAGRR